MRCALISGLCGLTLVMASSAALAKGVEHNPSVPEAPTATWPVAVVPSDALPAVEVGPITISHSSAFAALRMLLARSGTGIGLTYAGFALPRTLRRPVQAQNLQGRLPGLVQQLADVAGFYYTYNAAARVLTVSGGREFNVTFHGSSVKAATVKARLQALGAYDVAKGVDRGSLVYLAGRQAQRRIVRYLDATWHKVPNDSTVADVSATPATPSTTSAPVTSDKPTVASSAPVHAKVRMWTVRSGESIAHAFRRWAKRAGWVVVWQAPELQAGVQATVDGPFEHAVMQVVRSLDDNGATLRPIFYDGNRVLRVTRGGR